MEHRRKKTKGREDLSKFSIDELLKVVGRILSKPGGLEALTRRDLRELKQINQEMKRKIREGEM